MSCRGCGIRSNVAARLPLSCSLQCLTYVWHGFFLDFPGCNDQRGFYANTPCISLTVIFQAKLLMCATIWTIVTVTHVAKILQAGFGQDLFPLTTTELHGDSPNRVTFTVTAAQHREGLQEPRGRFIAALLLASSCSLVDKQKSWQSGGRRKHLFRLEDSFYVSSMRRFLVV